MGESITVRGSKGYKIGMGYVYPSVNEALMLGP